MASLIHAHAVERACHQLEIACGESSVRKLADAVDDTMRSALQVWITRLTESGLLVGA